MHLLRKPGMYGIQVLIVKTGEPDDIVRIKTPEEVKEASTQESQTESATSSGEDRRGGTS